MQKIDNLKPISPRRAPNFYSKKSCFVVNANYYPYIVETMSQGFMKIVPVVFKLGANVYA